MTGQEIMKKIEYTPLWETIMAQTGISYSQVAGYIADTTGLSRSHVSRIRKAGQLLPSEAILRLKTQLGWSADRTMHLCFGIPDRSAETEEKLREAEQIKDAISVLVGGLR